MADDVILTTEGLTKEFRGFTAVDGVDLKVRRGTIHALIGPNGAGKTTCFNLLTKFLEPTRGRDRLQRPRHHRDEAGRHRPARPRALLPDLGRVPAPDGARERPHRAAAQARRLVRLLALRAGAARARRPRRCELIEAVGLADFAELAGGRALLRPQARARDRDDAGARPRDDAARRADGRHGPRGRRAHRRADPARRRQNRTILMVEHNLSVVASLSRPHHRAGARPGAGRGRLRRRSRRTRAWSKPISGPGHG